METPKLEKYQGQEISNQILLSKKTTLPSLITDMWSNIAEFCDLEMLGIVMTLNTSICSVIDSQYSWKSRVYREFPSDQIERMKDHYEEDYKTIFLDLKFEFALRKTKCPNYIRNRVYFRNSQDTTDTKILPYKHQYFQYDLGDVTLFRHSKLNELFRELFTTTKGELPSIDFRFSHIETKNGQYGVDIQLGMLRVIFQTWDPSRLNRTHDFMIATSTCLGCLCPKNDVRFFTSTYCMDCISVKPALVGFGYTSYQVGRSTTLIPKKEEHQGIDFCKSLFSYHQKQYADTYRLDDALLKKFPSLLITKSGKYYAFQCRMQALEGKENVLEGLLHLEVVNDSELDILRGFFMPREGLETDKFQPEFLQDCGKRMNVVGSVLDRWMSLAVYNREKKKNGFFVGGRYLLCESEGEQVKFVGFYYRADEKVYPKKEEGVDGIFSFVPAKDSST